VPDQAEYSAFESTLNSFIVSYRINAPTLLLPLLQSRQMHWGSQ